MSAFLYTLSLNAPRNCVQKNGRKRRSRSNLNWLFCFVISRSGHSRTRPLSGVTLDELNHRLHRVNHKLLVDPVVHFLAFLPALQHARFAQYAQVMRHGGTAQRRHTDDFADVQALTRLEREQDALPVLIAQCGIYL